MRHGEPTTPGQVSHVTQLPSGTTTRVVHTAFSVAELQTVLRYLHAVKHAR